MVPLVMFHSCYFYLYLHVNDLLQVQGVSLWWMFASQTHVRTKENVCRMVTGTRVIAQHHLADHIVKTSSFLPSPLARRE